MSCLCVLNMYLRKAGWSVTVVKGPILTVLTSFSRLKANLGEGVTATVLII